MVEVFIIMYYSGSTIFSPIVEPGYNLRIFEWKQFQFQMNYSKQDCGWGGIKYSILSLVFPYGHVLCTVDSRFRYIDLIQSDQLCSRSAYFIQLAPEFHQSKQRFVFYIYNDGNKIIVCTMSSF